MDCIIECTTPNGAVFYIRDDDLEQNEDIVLTRMLDHKSYPIKVEPASSESSIFWESMLIMKT